jgi:protein SCO1
MFRNMAGFVIAAALVSGCSRPAVREYELQGQVLAVDLPRRQVTIKHGDIPQFMPAMTMTFTVRDERSLDGRVPGDLVRATLVVGDGDAHLRSLERTGFEPVAAEDVPAPAAAVVREGDAVADAAFVDESGTPRTLAAWRGNAVALTFIYTRCPLPDFCPLMDRHFKAVQDAVVSDDELRGHVRLLSVSFDPEYDTPAVLAKHAASARADPSVWTFLTGDPEAIRRFAAQFGVTFAPGEAGSPEIMHNLRTAVIGPDGRLVTIFTGNGWTPSELTAALRKARAGA